GPAAGAGVARLSMAPSCALPGIRTWCGGFPRTCRGDDSVPWVRVASWQLQRRPRRKVVVIRELLNLIAGDEPYRGLADALNAMLRHASSMVHAGLEDFWSGSPTGVDGASLSQADIQLNKQERQLRKELL